MARQSFWPQTGLVLRGHNILLNLCRRLPGLVLRRLRSIPQIALRPLAQDIIDHTAVDPEQAGSGRYIVTVALPVLNHRGPRGFWAGLAQLLVLNPRRHGVGTVSTAHTASAPSPQHPFPLVSAPPQRIQYIRTP